MSSMADQKDILNDAQTYVKNWLFYDVKVKAASYDTKFISEERQYSQADIPAISVSCTGLENNNNGFTTITGIVEAYIINYEVHKANEKMKELIAEIYYSLKRNFIPGLVKDTSLERIRPITAQAVPSELMGGNRAYGTVTFSIRYVHNTR